MKTALIIAGMVIAAGGCGHTEDHTVHAREPRAEPSRAEEERAAERRAEERRAEEKREAAYGGGPADPGSAAARIAAARCEREVRCNDVGTHRKYASRADCVAWMQAARRDDFDERECPRGIDKKQLNACISAIRDEACNGPLDNIERLTACRSNDICWR
jgi:hypothetical protein